MSALRANANIDGPFGRSRAHRRAGARGRRVARDAGDPACAADQFHRPRTRSRRVHALDAGLDSGSLSTIVRRRVRRHVGFARHRARLRSRAAPRDTACARGSGRVRRIRALVAVPRRRIAVRARACGKLERLVPRARHRGPHRRSARIRTPPFRRARRLRARVRRRDRRGARPTRARHFAYGRTQLFARAARRSRRQSHGAARHHLRRNGTVARRHSRPRAARGDRAARVHESANAKYGSARARAAAQTHRNGLDVSLRVSGRCGCDVAAGSFIVAQQSQTRARDRLRNDSSVARKRQRTAHVRLTDRAQSDARHSVSRRAARARGRHVGSDAPASRRSARILDPVDRAASDQRVSRDQRLAIDRARHRRPRIALAIYAPFVAAYERQQLARSDAGS